MNQRLLIICGPTATGKTALAVKLAQKFNGELISADSRQVYKGMDIVSGKDIPENSEMRTQSSELQIKEKNYEIGFRKINGVSVWLVDVVYPDQAFSVAHFVKYAQIVTDDILKRGKLPIVVGGTGLYIKALIDGTETIGIPPNFKLRRKLSIKSTEELQIILQKLNPQRFSIMNNSDKNNPRRLIRAIGIEAFKSQNPKYAKPSCPIGKNCDIFKIGLKAPREVLLKRITKRVLERIKSGAFEEVKKLLKEGYSQNLPSMTGDGYKELIQFYHDKMNRKEAVEKWIRSDLEHARKQMVWFKKDKMIRWFDITQKNYYQQCEYVVKKWYNDCYDKSN